MIEQTVKIIRISAGKATGESLSKSGCARCEAGEGCGGGIFSKLFGNKTFHIELQNQLNANIGEHIVIGLSERALTLGSLLLYLIPLIGLVFGAVIGDQLDANQGEFWTLLLSLTGFALNLGVVHLIVKNGILVNLFKPVMLYRASSVNYCSK